MNYNPTYLGDIELSEDTLEHYGIKGMKWRNRKGRASSQRYVDSDYQYQYDPNTKQRYRVLNMDKLMKRGKWKPKKVEIGVSQVTRSSSGRKPRARKRNVTGSGRGAYRKGSGLGYKVGR